MFILFENLRKYPVAYLLFLSLCTIVSLYIQGRSDANDRDERYRVQIEQLTVERKQLDSLLRDCMQKNGAVTTIEKIKTKNGGR